VYKIKVLLALCYLAFSGCRSAIKANVSKAVQTQNEVGLVVQESNTSPGSGGGEFDLSWDTRRQYPQYDVVVSRSEDCENPFVQVAGIKNDSVRIKISEPGTYWVCLFGVGSTANRLLARKDVTVGGEFNPTQTSTIAPASPEAPKAPNPGIDLVPDISIFATAEGVSTQEIKIRCTSDGEASTLLPQISSIAANDAGCIIGGDSFQCTPGFRSGHADWDVLVTLACSERGHTVEKSLRLHVSDVNRGFSMESPASQTISAGAAVYFDLGPSSSNSQPQDFDADGDSITYDCAVKRDPYGIDEDCAALPGQISFATATGILNWQTSDTVATGGYRRTYYFKITGIENHSEAHSSQAEFTVTVDPPAPLLHASFDVPAWGELGTTSNVGSTITQTLSATKEVGVGLGLRAAVTSGSAGYVSSLSWDPVTKIAAGFWIRIQPGFVATDNDVVQVLRGGPSFSVSLVYSTTAPAGWRVRVQDNVGVTTSTVPLWTDAWNHVVASAELHNSAGARAIWIDGISRGSDSGVASSGTISSFDQIGAAGAPPGVTLTFDIDELKAGRSFESVQPGVITYDFETSGWGGFASADPQSTLLQSATAAKHGAMGMRVDSVNSSRGRVVTRDSGYQQTMYVGVWYRMPSNHTVHPPGESPYCSLFRSNPGGRPDGWLRYWGSDGAMKFMYHNASTYNKSADPVPSNRWVYLIFGSRISFSGVNDGFRHVFVDGTSYISAVNQNTFQAVPPGQLRLGADFATAGMSVQYDMDDVKIGHSYDSVRP